MRIRLVGALIVGFAAGVLCLSAALWRFGGLRITAPRLTLRFVSPAQPAQPSVPLDLNSMVAQAKEMAAQPPAAPPPPVESLLPPPSSRGGADRTPDLGAPHLGMPIAGIHPDKLSDNFNEVRGGHKHEALDIMAPRGTPVLAVAEGNVAKLFNSKQGGLTVYQFDNTGKWCFYYAHLDHYASGLSEGTLLRKGDVLGYVGSSGDAPENAPHLHLAVFKLGPDRKWWEGTPVDPLPLLP